jgi:N-acyl-D-aspartate/D-glutamate deacylase
MGEPVPSRWASEEELLALARTVRDYPGTWLEIVPGIGPYGERETRLVTEMSLAAERPINWNAIFVATDRKALIDSQLTMNRRAAEHGAKVWGLAQVAPVKAFLNFHSGFTFAMLEGWKPFLQLDPVRRIAAMADPAYRARLRTGAESPNNPAKVLAGLEHYRIEDVRSAKNARWRQRPLAEYAAHIGRDPFDALFDLAVEEELHMTFSGPPMGADDASWDLRRQVWDDEHTLLGGSDAGAHLDMFNTFALTTQLLGEAVRERGVYSLERGVQRITSEQADAFGIKERGRIVEGACADLVVFDPDTIDCGAISIRDDLPGGESRLCGDSIGIHHVIVNGVPVAAGNEPTGRLGGRMLRSGRDTVTVTLDA